MQIFFMAAGTLSTPSPRPDEKQGLWAFRYNRCRIVNTHNHSNTQSILSAFLHYKQWLFAACHCYDHRLSNLQRCISLNILQKIYQHRVAIRLADYLPSSNLSHLQLADKALLFAMFFCHNHIQGLQQQQPLQCKVRCHLYRNLHLLLH